MSKDSGNVNRKYNGHGRLNGTMTALHLQAEHQPEISAACGTKETSHLLNVSAGKISASPDRPAHFFDWLQAHDAEWAEAGSVKDEMERSGRLFCHRGRLASLLPPPYCQRYAGGKLSTPRARRRRDAPLPVTSSTARARSAIPTNWRILSPQICRAPQIDFTIVTRGPFD